MVRQHSHYDSIYSAAFTGCSLCSWTLLFIYYLWQCLKKKIKQTNTFLYVCVCVYHLYMKVMLCKAYILIDISYLRGQISTIRAVCLKLFMNVLLGDNYYNYYLY